MSTAEYSTYIHSQGNNQQTPQIDMNMNLLYTYLPTLLVVSYQPRPCPGGAPGVLLLFLLLLLLLLLLFKQRKKNMGKASSSSSSLSSSPSPSPSPHQRRERSPRRSGVGGGVGAREVHVEVVRVLIYQVQLHTYCRYGIGWSEILFKAGGPKNAVISDLVMIGRQVMLSNLGIPTPYEECVCNT